MDEILMVEARTDDRTPTVLTPTITLYDGYTGLFTRDQAKGALPNGTRVMKVNTEPGDGHKIGDRAVVLGSMDSGLPLHSPAPFFYFVEWDDMPGIAVGVISSKVEAA